MTDEHDTPDDTEDAPDAPSADADAASPPSTDDTDAGSEDAHGTDDRDARTDQQPRRRQPGQSRSAAVDDGRDVRALLLRGVLVVLGLLAVVALFQFYTSANAAIGQWVAAEYRAVLRAAFNLAVLLAAGIGISLVVRELAAEDA